MNIIEAIKSGKRFKRIGTNPSFWRDNAPADNLDGYSFILSAGDILAGDWEVEEEKRELSWEQITSALEKHRTWTPNGAGFNLGFKKDELKKELGF